jgi:hypothetical protein
MTASKGEAQKKKRRASGHRIKQASSRFHQPSCQMKAAVAMLRKIWRQICRQIFRKNRTLTLPVPAHPRGQESGAVPGTFESPLEPPRALLEELTENVVSRLPDMD